MSERLYERLLETFPRALHRVEVLDLLALAVVHVERVVRLIDLRGDARARDVEPEARERTREQVEQADAVGALHLDHRVRVREVVVDGDLRRSLHPRRPAPGA